jgi:hypothetical protein
MLVAAALWRVTPYHFEIESYLQVRTASGWTKGRKLAIKHLVHGGDLLRQLGEDDAKVAAFARERREIYSGYPQVSYLMARGALAALVGHPRVYLGDADTPCEVARGVVQVVARSEGDQLAVTIDPQLGGAEIEVRIDWPAVTLLAVARRSGDLGAARSTRGDAGEVPAHWRERDQATRRRGRRRQGGEAPMARSADYARAITGARHARALEPARGDQGVTCSSSASAT